MERQIEYTKRIEKVLLTINTAYTPAFKFEVGEDGLVDYHGERITPKEATERFPSDSGLEILSSSVAKVVLFRGIGDDGKERVLEYFWDTPTIII